MKYRPRSCYERSPQSFGGLRSDRSAAQPGRPPGLGRSSRNDASITDRANTRVGKAKRAHRSVDIAKDGGHGASAPLPTLLRRQLFAIRLPQATATFTGREIASTISAAITQSAPAMKKAGR